MTEDTRQTTSESRKPHKTTERARYSWTETETPSVGVAEAVAAATDRDTTSLPQLTDAIDPDALNELFGDAESTDNDLHVSFEYADVSVTVNSAGTVVVTTD